MNGEQAAFLAEVRKILGPPEYIKPEEVPLTEISDHDRLCENPLVSVVCITYNHAKYIEKTFRGFEEQVTTFPYEIIVGEDCSKDNTLERCKSFRKKHPDKVRLLTGEKNVGALANLLRTELVCRGKYIAFCEGDDFWCCPTKLQEQVDYLEAHPDCGFVHSNANVVSADHKNIVRKWNSMQQEQLCLRWDGSIQDVLDRKVRVSSGTVLIRSSILFSLQTRYPHVYTRARILGDLQLWIGALSMGGQHYMAEVFSSYTLSKNSATRSGDPMKSLRFICDSLEVRLEVNELFLKGDISNRMHFLEESSSAMLFLAYQIKNHELLDSIVCLRVSEGFVNTAATRTLLFSYRHNFSFLFAHTALRLLSLLNRFRKIFLIPY